MPSPIVLPSTAHLRENMHYLDIPLIYPRHARWLSSRCPTTMVRMVMTASFIRFLLARGKLDRIPSESIYLDSN